MSLTDRAYADAREVRGWQLYDWANSAFTTTVVAALAGPYLTSVAKAGAGPDGVLFRVLGFGVTDESYFPYVVSVSVLLQVLVLPLLGALTDGLAGKKPVLLGTCLIGATATTGMLWVSGGRWLLGGVLFAVANLAFGASIVVYNAFLPEIAPPQDQDRVSSGGFALGYLGGGLLLALDLALVTGHDAVGLSTREAARLSLASAGVWWGLFGLLAVRRLTDRAVPRERVSSGLVRTGVQELRGSVQELRALPGTLRFLIAFLLYNDAVQAVIGLSSVFLAQELYVARGRSADDATPFLLGLVLLIQFVAAPGALGVERVARRVGAKRAVMGTLVVWIGIVVYAYGFLETTTQAYVLGAVIAVVLGGSQALSRSLFASMVPPGREASFFGFYEISERGTAWIATATFATVLALTGSYRQAILSLVVLFLLGLALLARTDTDAARQAAAAQPLPAGEEGV